MSHLHPLAVPYRLSARSSDALASWLARHWRDVNRIALGAPRSNPEPLFNPLDNPTTRRVYAIDLDPRAHHGHQGKNGRPAIYIGQTGLSPQARFREHKSGSMFASDVVTRYGRKLHPETWGPFDSIEAAEREEKRVADLFRRRGYNVFGGH